jgi:hypothetical protein
MILEIVAIERVSKVSFRIVTHKTVPVRIEDKEVEGGSYETTIQAPLEYPNLVIDIIMETKEPVPIGCQLLDEDNHLYSSVSDYEVRASIPLKQHGQYNTPKTLTIASTSHKEG